MTIEQCDKCQQVIERHNRARIQFGPIAYDIELCLACAEPIIKILKNYELPDNSWQKYLPIAKAAV